MGCETEHFSAGNRRVIVPYRGWNICLQVCYDLRFPVWSRNINNEYDLLIYIASWPTPRIHAWNTLLCARAIENQCYVCGVNRTGRDGNGLHYPGYSALYSPKGEILTGTPDSEEKIQTIELDIETLTAFRHKFPSWKDADSFLLY
jgi:omega-amidase